MSMLDIHKAALETIDENFHNFLLRYKADSKLVYGIVEGSDDPMYYKGIIERFLPEDWSVSLLPGGNKNRVISSFRSFDWERFSDKRIAFFIDRDLDEFVPGDVPDASNIYTTDGYSIENSIVNVEVFIRLLSEVCNVRDLNSEEEHSLRDKFEVALQQFQDHMSPIMAQIIDWRTREAPANLNNLDLKRMFVYSDGNFSISEDFQNDASKLAHASAGVGQPVSANQVLATNKYAFEAKNGPRRFTRGKYLIWHLSQYVNTVHKSIDQVCSAYNKPPKVSIQIGPANVMTISAPRTRCPSSLREFLNRTYLAYVTTR